MSVNKLLPISALPVPSPDRILTRKLNPDPATPPATFKDVLKKTPSVQRRSRIIESSAHFSHLTPLLLPFPYRIIPPEGEEIEDKAAFVENWLSSYEALEERPLAPSSTPGIFKKYSGEKREIDRELIGLSDTGLRDCVPQLAVGDAFVQIGSPTLARSDEDEPQRPCSGADKAVRQELVDVLSGHSVLMRLPEEGSEESTYAPWSLRYSGHQFGVWAGQLGDGRAMSILEVQHPKDPNLSYELQLKGAGRTPYARSADGLAVLRSSIREFLCAEAMHALHIPTTRSLALIHLPQLDVIREQRETACVLTRMAPSFIRIGSFEALNPPKNIFFLGGGQQDADWEALRVLGEWVSRNVLKLDLKENEPWGKKLVMECARRNAKMVAGWQAYGFMHGVINTDNVSILGLTIDYGPYAFMDIFNNMHICNHSDEEGRYAYKYQPTMIVYALHSLLLSLSPLIGAETELGTAVPSGWASEVTDDQLDDWTHKGMQLDTEIKHEVESVFEAEYWSLFRKRLALRRSDESDKDKIVRALLNTMQTHNMDFHSTFRRLCFFTPDAVNTSSPEKLDAFVNSLLSTAQPIDTERAQTELKPWLEAYAARITSEKDEGLWPGGDDERTQTAKKANPRFVLRQWVLEETIKRVQTDPPTGKRALAKVHEMAVKPFDAWGAEGDERPEDELDDEIKEERRFCGMGAKRMLGFQCSCSS